MKKNGFNQTAYRIIMLLQWLNQQPLSLDQINQKFIDDPKIGKTLSQDTMGLYMNTLRAIGCEIERPKPSNQYCYTLIYHPFSYFLKDDDIHFLFQMIHYVDESTTYRDMLHRMRFILRVIRGSANTNRKELEHRFYEATRIRDLDQLEQIIDNLEYYCTNETVLDVIYRSPTNKKLTRRVLPEKLLYWSDSIYLQAYLMEYEGCVLLRVDRIDDIKSIDDPELFEALNMKRYQQDEIWIRFVNCTQDDLPIMDYVDVSDFCQDPIDHNNTLVKFKTSNLFFLKQALLESGHLFQVISPATFRQEMSEFLKESKGRYINS